MSQSWRWSQTLTWVASSKVIPGWGLTALSWSSIVRISEREAAVKCLGLWCTYLLPSHSGWKRMVLNNLKMYQ